LGRPLRLAVVDTPRHWRDSPYPASGGPSWDSVADARRELPRVIIGQQLTSLATGAHNRACCR
jgi:hypothetical protein